MRIIDCCIIRDELDLLRIRLRELWEAVDVFVIVEANKTFNGEDKAFYAEDLLWKYQLNMGKQEIRYIKLEDTPDPAETDYRPDLHHGTKWNIQFFQRNAIMRGLHDLTDDDIIMISDVDEIWDPSVFNEDIEPPIVFEQLPMVGYLNVMQTHSTWYGTMAIRRGHLLERTPQDLRMLKDGFSRVKGGWHLSWMGGPEELQEKMKYSSHPQEECVSSGYNPSAILQRIKNREGVEEIDISRLPKLVRENVGYFKGKGMLV